MGMSFQIESTWQKIKMDAHLGRNFEILEHQGRLDYPISFKGRNQFHTRD